MGTCIKSATTIIVADKDLYFKTFPWQQSDRLHCNIADRDISSFKWLLTDLSGFELMKSWRLKRILFRTLACLSRGFGSHAPSEKLGLRFFERVFFQTLIPFLLEDLKGQLEHWKPRDIVWVFIPPPLELSSRG